VRFCASQVLNRVRVTAPERRQCGSIVGLVRVHRIGRLSAVALLGIATLSMLGCGADFDQWTADGRALADEVGAEVVGVERLEDSGGSMFDDDPSHVEVFATLDATPAEAREQLRAAGERLGYRVVDAPYLLMTRDGSVINVRVFEDSSAPLDITIAAN
jgi:hypothetical protein